MPHRSNNAVINRSHNEVGVGRSTGLLPPGAEGMTYGAPTKADPETAGKVIFDWPKPPERKEVLDHGRDFLRLNKLAVHEGNATAAEVAQFRASHDCRLTTKPGQVLKLKHQSPNHPNPDHVFGVRRLDKVSMGELLQHNAEVQEVPRHAGRGQTHPQPLRMSVLAPTASSLSHGYMGQQGAKQYSKCQKAGHQGPLNLMASLDGPLYAAKGVDGPLEEAVA